MSSVNANAPPNRGPSNSDGATKTAGVLNVIAGVWLIASGFVLGYANHPAAALERHNRRVYRAGCRVVEDIERWHDGRNRMDQRHRWYLAIHISLDSWVQRRAVADVEQYHSWDCRSGTVGVGAGNFAASSGSGLAS